MRSCRPCPVVLAVLVVLAAAVPGCTRSEAGQATARPTGTPTSGPATSSASASPSGAPTATIPPRPRELRLDGVDPCTLFTQAQLGELTVDHTRRTTNGSRQFRGMPQCVLEVRAQRPFYNYTVTAATNEGIEPWFSGKRNVEAKLATVAGFAAATYWIRGASGTDTDGCTTSVDVAEGQQLTVDTNNDGGHSFTLEQLCQRAEAAAALAVETLQTLR